MPRPVLTAQDLEKIAEQRRNRHRPRHANHPASPRRSRRPRNHNPSRTTQIRIRSLELRTSSSPGRRSRRLRTQRTTKKISPRLGLHPARSRHGQHRASRLSRFRRSGSQRRSPRRSLARRSNRQRRNRQRHSRQQSPRRPRRPMLRSRLSQKQPRTQRRQHPLAGRQNYLRRNRPRNPSPLARNKFRSRQTPKANRQDSSNRVQASNQGNPVGEGALALPPFGHVFSGKPMRPKTSQAQQEQK